MITQQMNFLIWTHNARSDLKTSGYGNSSYLRVDSVCIGFWTRIWPKPQKCVLRKRGLLQEIAHDIVQFLQDFGAIRVENLPYQNKRELPNKSARLSGFCLKSKRGTGVSVILKTSTPRFLIPPPPSKASAKLQLAYSLTGCEPSNAFRLG